MKTYYTLAIKSEDGTYTPIHTRGASRTDSRVPVVEDASIAGDRIKHHVLPDNGINLEGIVINLTTWIIGGVLEEGKLEILN